MFVREEWVGGREGGEGRFHRSLEWQEIKSGKLVLALGNDFLTIRFVSRGTSYQGDNKIKGSNKRLTIHMEQFM